MSKITTQDCKQFLIEHYEDSNVSDWSRTKKYKNEHGFWIRDFINKKTQETVALKEQDGSLFLLEKEQSYPFVFYRKKGSPDDFEWSVYIGVEDEEDEEETDKLTTLVYRLFPQNELSLLDGPNFSCEAKDAWKVHDTLIKAGWNFKADMVDNSYFEIFSPEKLKKISGKKINISAYTLIEALGRESKEKKLDPDYFKQVVFVVQNLEMPELLKVHGFKKFLNPLPNSSIMAKIEKELIERKNNPNKTLHATTLSLSQVIGRKLGL